MFKLLKIVYCDISNPAGFFICLQKWGLQLSRKGYEFGEDGFLFLFEYLVSSNLVYLRECNDARYGQLRYN